MVRIGARLAGEGDAETAWMVEIAMTALASAIDETGAFEVGDQFPEFSGHSSIKTILLRSASDLCKLGGADAMGSPRAGQRWRSNWNYETSTIS